jgi:hypothetical protein
VAWADIDEHGNIYADANGRFEYLHPDGLLTVAIGDLQPPRADDYAPEHARFVFYCKKCGKPKRVTRGRILEAISKLPPGKSGTL